MTDTARAGLALAALLACSAAGAAAPALPRLEFVPCWFEVPGGRRAECARLHVDQDRARPGKGEVVLPLVIYRSGAEFRQPDPLVVLGGGGPGNAVGIADDQPNEWWSFLDLLALDGGRDVVVVDQRGAGLAEPSLACDWSEGDAEDDLRQSKPIRRQVAELQRVLGRCREQLLAAGVDLAAYDATSAAHDFEDLRRALGVERWNLYGTSYAARIALTVLRHHAGGVRSVILDSAVTPEARFYEESPRVMAGAFAALFDACEGDAACRSRFPDMPTVFTRVVRRLQARPVTVTIAWPESLKPFAMQVDGERLVEILFQALYDSTRAARVPLVVHALDRGSVDLLAPLARDLVKQYVAGGWSDGLYYSVMCREELPFNDVDAALATAARDIVFSPFNSRWLETERAACRVWNVAPAEAAVERPVVADVPVLVLNGALDPVTPSDWGRAAAARLPKAWYQEFDGVGHDVLGSDDCALMVASEFLVSPQRDPGASRCAGHRAPVWFDLDY